jgi:DNA polymerase-4
MPVLCRDCLSGASPQGATGCAACGSVRLLVHDELERLAIAHLDCDAFYAAVEKRDDPTLADKPVIIGGRKRGVAMTCCYIARRFGVHSAMPMYKALAACPDAVVIRPDMEKYGRVGREVRAVMVEATPLVEPISIDEAFLDLSGTERLHGGSPARTLADLALRIEDRIGITVSAGLSYNKFLAKIASGLDKPRGFSVIGRAEAVGFLAEQPVRLLWGVGEVMQARLASDGITRIGQLQELPEAELTERYGRLGSRLARFSRGLDRRRVDSRSGRKSLSAETTFSNDISDPKALERRLWRLSEKVSARLKNEGIGGRTVTLKLKRADFKLRTRAATLPHPTQLAEVIWREGARLLGREADGTRFRLIGIGVSNYATAAECDPPDLADPGSFRRKEIERTMDSVRQRFGRGAIVKGRDLTD